MNDYIIFKYSHENDKKIYFGDNLGEAPYIYQKKLFFPIKIIEKYIEKLGYKKKEELNKEKYENIQELSDNYFLSKLNREPSGLVNIGGVCYMNALLQCFYYCFPMTKFFMTLNDISHLGTLTKGYFDFVRNLNSGNIYAAQNFKKALVNIDNSFSGNEGKDSKDLAILILSEIHEELIGFYNFDQPYNKLDSYNEKLEIDKKNGNGTIISETFFYNILYEQICEKKTKKCQYSTLTFDIQSDNIIIFELEKIYKNINKRCSSYPQISIEECLENYNKTEKINCPFCNTKTLAIKKSICSLPKIFIFVMSRGPNAKFKCKINFNKEIDMGKYYHPTDDKYKTYQTTYNLIGATFAIDWYKGSGHTVAFCKTYKNEEYYIFNDSTARKTEISEIYGRIPYILFYERKK